jgi:hypothetical protein
MTVSKCELTCYLLDLLKGLLANFDTGTQVTGLLQRHYYDTHLSVFRIPITISTILLWPRSSEMQMAPDSAHERSFALYTRPNACPSFSGCRVRGPTRTSRLIYEEFGVALIHSRRMAFYDLMVLTRNSIVCAYYLTL